MAFEDYYSFDAILGDLIRWRIRGRAGCRRDASSAEGVVS